MKPDRYTKIALTVIAISLGVLAFGRVGTPAPAVAQAAAPPGGFDNVALIPYGNVGFIMFDKNTGGVWVYHQKAEKGFPFELMTSGRIERPGAAVEQLPK